MHYILQINIGYLNSLFNFLYFSIELLFIFLIPFFKYIVYANQLTNGQLAIVEVTPLFINERLPPSLKQKKFGT